MHLCFCYYSYIYAVLMDKMYIYVSVVQPVIYVSVVIKYSCYLISVYECKLYVYVLLCGAY